jgi:hypothetical protein
MARGPVFETQNVTVGSKVAPFVREAKANLETERPSLVKTRECRAQRRINPVVTVQISRSESLAGGSFIGPFTQTETAVSSEYYGSGLGSLNAERVCRDSVLKLEPGLADTGTLLLATILCPFVLNRNAGDRPPT